MSIAELKKRRQATLNKLRETVEKDGKGGYEKDERFWELPVGKDGNGQAIIRFLPSTENNNMTWATVYSFFFKGPTGKWYVENCLRTIGKEDPVAEYNSKRWNEGFQDECRGRTQKTKYISNILVVKDPANPENEGKVFLFEYGKVVMDMIKNKLTPDFDDDEPVNPFDLWEGCNLRLKVYSKRVPGFKNPVKQWENSVFDGVSAVGDDDYIEEVYSKVYDISEFTDPANMKSYDELKKKFNEVMGFNGVANKPAQESYEDEFANDKKPASVEDEIDDEIPEFNSSDDDDDEFMKELLADINDDD